MTPRITPTSLLTMSPNQVIAAISEQVLADIPEGIKNGDDLWAIEQALGRLSNHYSYVIELLSYSRNYVRQLKRSGEKEKYEDMMDTRDALESIASALKIKYQAVSRMLTSFENRMDEQTMYEYRKGRQDGHSNPY